MMIKHVLLVFATLFFVRGSKGQPDTSFLTSVSLHRSRRLQATDNAVITNTAENCTAPAIFDFPSDGLSREQRQRGWIVLHILVACYCFWVLAIVCEDHFVPVVYLLSKSLHISDDVAGSTIMAAAFSIPELFTNCVGTFITEGDMGIASIVGSAAFNILAVLACCCLFVGHTVHLDWWPVTRDSAMFCMSTVGLIYVLYDGMVVWYEALGLVMGFFGYLAVIFHNDMLSERAQMMASMCPRNRKLIPFTEVTELTPLFKGAIRHEPAIPDEPKMSDSTPWFTGDICTIRYIFKWPIIFILWLTIPDFRRYPNLRLLNFILYCIVWIGLISYIVSFTITVLGDTLQITDSVTGLTFLAMGMSLPEAVSGVIVMIQGRGAMCVSNAFGSNTFAILLGLGVPWLIKAVAFPVVPGVHAVYVNSSGLVYDVGALLLALLGLYIAFLCNSFRMNWKIGSVCVLMYGAFLVVVSLVELNYFFAVNLPICEQ